MSQTRRGRNAPAWLGFLAGLTCFAVTGCQTVAPPPLPPSKHSVTVDKPSTPANDHATPDARAAERTKLQAKFHEALNLYVSGHIEPARAMLRDILKECADDGIALPPSMDAQLHAMLTPIPGVAGPQPTTAPAASQRQIAKIPQHERKPSPKTPPPSLSSKPPPDITEVHLPALTEPAMADQLIPMDFNAADIRIVIKAISELTGLNFLLDEGVKGTVTLISPTKVRRGDVYKVLQSILESKGFATSPAGNLIKIMPRAEINKRNLPYGIGNDPAAVPQNDTLVTWIIPLTYAAASDVGPIITPLTGGTVVPYPPTNSLMVTDNCSNIRRVLEIVKNFDLPGEQQDIEVIPLKHAQASDLCQEILQVLEKQAASASSATSSGASPGGAFGHAQQAPSPLSASGSGGGGGGSKGGATIIPESRTNSLIVVANVRLMDSIEELVGQLDTERSLETGNIHVVYLENAEAKDMAKSLQTALQSATGDKGAAAKSSAMNIQADEDTNALIIVASPEDYQVVASVIKQLDIERDQVLVELRIVEVSEDLLRNLGVELATLDAAGSGVSQFGGTSFGLASQLASDAASGTASGASLGAFKMVNGSAKNAALINMLETDTRANVISTPTVVTANNHKAKITVGENIPYISQSSVTYQTSTNPQQVNTYDYKDVGVILEMTPHISKGGLVRMEIDSTYTQILPTALSTTTPTTTKRSEQTVVTIQNGATIVIGGLISDNKTSVVQKVPLLGDIPLIGFLFTNSTKEDQKDDLLLFITPHILASQQPVAIGADADNLAAASK